MFGQEQQQQQHHHHGKRSTQQQGITVQQSFALRLKDSPFCRPAMPQHQQKQSTSSPPPLNRGGWVLDAEGGEAISSFYQRGSRRQ
jgi:hypothetical protein